ncbi:MAG: N-acetylmuramoyl-L-alanine amidase [Flavobacteriales bacterium]|nr:N-acetylmuramoyl-L-alanine amidase [Flavobacteriales bacterium]
MVKLFTIISFLLLFASNLFSQKSIYPKNTYQADFESAYNQCPDIPRGILESIAFTTTRFQHLNNETESCIGIPPAFGVMGLTLDGKGYFRNNLIYISQLSGMAIEEILLSPEKNILAFAKAYNSLLQEASFDKSKLENQVSILVALSELPVDGILNDFAINSHLYSIFNFLNDENAQKIYNFPKHTINLESIFGIENLKILSSSKVIVTENSVSTVDGKLFNSTPHSTLSADYAPAIWDAAASCNYSSRSGTAVGAVTIHTVQGTYAGCISWFKNCSASVSAHYVLRSSDGQVTQMVLESNKAWHVGTENPYTIGYEHEGYVNNPSWYTTAMYQASADLTKDVTQSGYGIAPIRTAYFPWAPTTNYSSTSTPGSCTKVKGHQHYPNQSHTDPGANWDWDYYYKLINSGTSIITNTNTTGTTTDDGGNGNYSDDARTLYLIQPTGATSITLTINSFSLENNWDYLYVYNGTTPFSPLVGYYTGTSIPSTITVNSGNVLLEFRSDCATNASGYNISWNSVSPDVVKPTTVVNPIANPIQDDFTATFTDADNIGGSGILHQFYQVIDFDGTEWRANKYNGFFSDNFDTNIHPDWILATGNWGISGGNLTQTDDTLTNTNIYSTLDQNSQSKYLYHWAGKIEGTGNNRRAGFHFMCDDASLTNRGNSYFVWFRLDNSKIQIYKVVNDVFTLEQDVSYTFTASTWYDFKVTCNKTNGEIDVFINDVFSASWIDTSPLSVGNAISFRSGDAIYSVNNLKVYHNRGNSQLITVGNDTLSDIRFEGTPAGKVKSIVIDNAKNVSTISEHLVDVGWTTAIQKQNEIEMLKIYPNPVSDVLFVELSSIQTIKNCTIRDANGKIISTPNVSARNKIQVDVSKLPSGIYFLEIEFENSIHKEQFIKK